jgi:carbon storage regulator
MLVLTRRFDESIQIGPDITITVVRIGPGSVRIGIEAPEGLGIARSELLDCDGKWKQKIKRGAE